MYSHCSLPIFCSSTKLSEDIKFEEDKTIFINNLLLPKGPNTRKYLSVWNPILSHYQIQTLDLIVRQNWLLSDNEYDLNCSLKQKSVMQLMKLGVEKP